MNFLGMGPLEILLVLLVAFIFVGPDKMVDAAKLMGKATREGKRLMSELPKVVIEDDDIKILDMDSQRLARNEPAASSKPAPETAKQESSSDDADDADDAQESESDDGPVSFRSGDPAPPKEPPSETTTP